MRGMKRSLRYFLCGAGVQLGLLCTMLTPAFAQNVPKVGGKVPGPVAGGFDQMHELPPGGPAPRMADGHPDLTGRWYPNGAGRMLQVAYPVDPVVFRQFDAKASPEEPPSFKPGLAAKYTRPLPYGICDQPGTPSATLEQISQHAPMELVQSPGRLVVLNEYPLDVRMIYLNGRAHPKDPDPTFNGDSAAHWEGDTLVIDTIGFNDTSWLDITGYFHSENMHVIERMHRDGDTLTWQATVEDPDVLIRPWTMNMRSLKLNPDPKAWLTETLPCVEHDLSHLVTKEHH